MKIITHTCPDCGTIVAANELEANRVMKCPGLECESILRFDVLSNDAREHFLRNKDQYEI